MPPLSVTNSSVPINSHSRSIYGSVKPASPEHQNVKKLLGQPPDNKMLRPLPANLAVAFQTNNAEALKNYMEEKNLQVLSLAVTTDNKVSAVFTLSYLGRNDGFSMEQSHIEISDALPQTLNSCAAFEDFFSCLQTSAENGNLKQFTSIEHPAPKLSGSNADNITTTVNGQEFILTGEQREELDGLLAPWMKLDEELKELKRLMAEMPDGHHRTREQHDLYARLMAEGYQKKILYDALDDKLVRLTQQWMPVDNER